METRCEKYKYLFWTQPPKDSQFKKSFSFPRVLENSGWSISYQQKSLRVMNKERRPKETLWSLCVCGCSSPRPSQTSTGNPSKSSCITQAQQPGFKGLATNIPMLQGEGQRGGFSVSPWGPEFQLNEAPSSERMFMKWSLCTLRITTGLPSTSNLFWVVLDT